MIPLGIQQLSNLDMVWKKWNFCTILEEFLIKNGSDSHDTYQNYWKSQLEDDYCTKLWKTTEKIILVQKHMDHPLGNLSRPVSLDSNPLLHFINFTMKLLRTTLKSQEIFKISHCAMHCSAAENLHSK